MALNLGPLNVLLNLKGANKFEREAENASNALSGVGKAVRGVASSFALLEISQKAYEFAKSAATLEDATRIFQASGGNLKELRAATKGLVDDFSLVKQANLAKTMGIPTEAMSTFAKAAIAASKATGESVDFMMESIVKGVARGSPMILDNLGLIVSVDTANDEYARTLGKTAAKLTEAEKKQAFLNAALKAAEPLIASADKAGANAADAYTRLETSIKNIGSAIGTGMAPAVRAAISLLEDLANAVSAIYTLPTTGRLSEVGRERMKNAARQQEIQRMLSTGGFKASYPVGHPLGGMSGVLPTMPQAQAPSQNEVLLGRYTPLTDKQTEQLQRELNRLREREADLLRLENKEREPKPDAPVPLSDQEKEKQRRERFEAAAQAYRFEIAPTDFESAAGGIVDVLAKIGYDGAIATKASVEAAFSPSVVGNIMSPLREATQGQASAAELAAEAMHRAALQTTATVSEIRSFGAILGDATAAIRGNTVGATFGPAGAGALGSMIGTAIAPGIGGAVGQEIGEIVGQTFGPMFDAVNATTDVFRGFVENWNATAAALFAPILVGLGPALQVMAEYQRNVAIPVLTFLGDVIGTLAWFFSELSVGVQNFTIWLDNLTKDDQNKIPYIVGKTFEQYMQEVEETRRKVLEALNDETVTTTNNFRELNEELTNVPIGVKRLRALQFNATRGAVSFPGRFTAPAFGA
jgi:hypothetical protein